MELLNIKILRGPNYWSNYRKKLIVLTIKLNETEDRPTNEIPGFVHQLKTLMPTLGDHYCSEMRPGGFLERLQQGTFLGHVMEHIALELQWLSGIKCGFGRTRSSHQPGEYYVIFSYKFESAGVYAGKRAFAIVNQLAQQQAYNHLAHDLASLKKINENERFGPSTQAIVDELDERDIPYERLDKNSLLLLGQGCHQKMIWATETSFTSNIGVDIAADKALTKEILQKNYIPVPMGLTIEDEAEIDQAISTLNFPLVIKPINANHGRGVTTNILTKEALLYAFKLAKKHANKIIVEEYIKGNDYRFLIINYNVVAVAKRTPAYVIGDGFSTIKMLINNENKNPKRGARHENFLSLIEIDETTLSILNSNHLTLETILPQNKKLYLKYAANISSGGTAQDVTYIVHPEYLLLVERVVRLIGLDICGVDVIAENITLPFSRDNCRVIEVNSSPGFRMHLDPNKGGSQRVAKAVVEMLYPKDSKARIQLVAITGTNGKTTVVRMLAYIASAMNYHVGYTTTDGISINGHDICQGDCSGPESAKIVLRDPLVNFAILECARGGILRSGLGFDHCDVSIVTNIQEDHLGLNGILTLEDLRRLKSVVPHSTFKKGYSILNADDELVYSLKDEIDCNIALFGIEKNSRILAHLSRGGIACYIDQEYLTIANGTTLINLGHVQEIPISFLGKASSMIQNLLPTALAAYVCGFDVDLIKKCLFSFTSSPNLLPGRMNVFRLNSITLLLDYAHNPHAFLELKKYINEIKASKKVGIIAATGDRREIDIINIGKYSAEMFDEIVIKHDRDGRGRTNDELTNLLMTGINDVSKNIKVTVISNEFHALAFSIKNAPANSFIFYFPDEISEALNYLNLLFKKEYNKEPFL